MDTPDQFIFLQLFQGIGKSSIGDGFEHFFQFSESHRGFDAGKKSHTGERVRETGKVIITVPGESLAQAVMACGASTGAKVNKAAANEIEMKEIEGSDIQIPADTRLAMVATLQQSVEVGNHILHICQVDKFLGDESKKGLYASAWICSFSLLAVTVTPNHALSNAVENWIISGRFSPLAAANGAVYDKIHVLNQGLNTDGHRYLLFFVSIILCIFSLSPLTPKIRLLPHLPQRGNGTHFCPATAFRFLESLHLQTRVSE